METVVGILKKHGALAGIAAFLFIQNSGLEKRLDSVELKLYNCYEARILNSRSTAQTNTNYTTHRKIYAVLPEQIEIKRERKNEVT